MDTVGAHHAPRFCQARAKNLNSRGQYTQFQIKSTYMCITNEPDDL